MKRIIASIIISFMASTSANAFMIKCHSVHDGNYMLKYDPLIRMMIRDNGDLYEVEQYFQNDKSVLILGKRSNQSYVIYVKPSKTFVKYKDTNDVHSCNYTSQ